MRGESECERVRELEKERMWQGMADGIRYKPSMCANIFIY